MKYRLSNTGNIPMRQFAKEIGSSSNKVLDYLREKDILYSNNIPCPDYKDWFENIYKGLPTFRNDLTAKGQYSIREMIEKDGIDYVNNRKVNGINRKGKPRIDWRNEVT